VKKALVLCLFCSVKLLANNDQLIFTDDLTNPPAGQTAVQTVTECIPIFSDDFSAPANWSLQANGAVAVNNGSLNFTNAFAGVYNRVYQNIGSTLSDTYWRAECDLQLQNNASGNGMGAIIMALSADTFDFMAFDASQNYAATNHDGIAVTLTSLNVADNNPNNWFFLIQAKKGTVRTYDLNTGIYASSQLSNYYISLERTSTGNVRLSIYQDSLRTIHLPGSPANFAIDSTITGLDVIHHGSNTSGDPLRNLNCSIDNDFICSDVLNSVANQPEQLSPASFFFFPNPSNGMVFIKNEILASSINSTGNVYRVYEHSGKRIDAGKIDPSGLINLSDLPAAVYMLEVIIDSKRYSGKVILTKD
jgi:hypothetical protein